MFARVRLPNCLTYAWVLVQTWHESLGTHSGVKVVLSVLTPDANTMFPVIFRAIHAAWWSRLIYRHELDPLISPVVH